jgi:hypothetical protein
VWKTNDLNSNSYARVNIQDCPTAVAWSGDGKYLVVATDTSKSVLFFGIGIQVGGRSKRSVKINALFDTFILHA